MKFFDNHTHTNYEPLQSQFDAIYERCVELDLGMNIVGCDMLTNHYSLQQTFKYPNYCYSVIGLHPEMACKELNIDFAINYLKSLVTNNKDRVVAIGECGLDYYYHSDDNTKQYQYRLFKAQIELAYELGLPIMMHIRDAHDDVLKIMSEYKNKNLTWIVHCFSGSKDNLENYLCHPNCYLSISGVVTFKNNKTFQDVVKQIPIQRLLVETDAPWLAPAPYRGKINYPYYVIETSKFLAELFGMSLDEFSHVVMKNVSKVFGF